MAKRKKKAWNMSNPLYRYLHGKKKRVKSKRIKTRVVRMARKRHRVKSRGSMGGAGSMAKTALIGIGAAEFANMIPVSIPYKEEAVGAVAAYLIGGKSIKNAAIGGGAVYLKKMVLGQASSTGSSNAGFV